MSESRDVDKQVALDAERAVNEQYRREMDRLLARQPALIKQIALVQSQHWTTSSLPRPGIDHGTTAGIIGRVALEPDHAYSGEGEGDLGETFYVASWRVKEATYETVNWAAPVAGLFFEGRHSDYPIASSVTARRTFVLRLDDLVDFSDDVEPGAARPFAGTTPDLQIPAAPARRQPSAEAFDGALSVPVDDVAEVPGVVVGAVATPTPEPETTSARVAKLRAPDAVLKVMEMPKLGRMGAVLPTMQPDQYQLVAAAGGLPLIVQGHPGTGKTVIAAHRAVYLTSAERGPDRIARIAVVGPSDHYVDHVAPIISELKEPGAEIRVLSLPALLRTICPLRNLPKPGPIGRIESSWALGRAIDDFVRSMPDRPRSGGITERVRRVVEVLSNADASQVADPEILHWLRELPTWNEVTSQAAFQPMLATIALALDPRAGGEWVGHLIVDEAQDVRPLEWRILTNSLLAPSGSLSLFGDINQRRSDWSTDSWQKLAEDLEMTDDEGRCHVHVLENGYRSTRQILRFANQLLPRGERADQALRDGPQPTIVKTSSDRRAASAVDAAIELTRRHPGRVALICHESKPTSSEFRRRGWVRARHPDSWALADATVVVLHPDEARGLEFDAAVVVEPGDFPENVGRQGVLYTSLTRANKELTVVHARALPRDLRPPRDPTKSRTGAGV